MPFYAIGILIIVIARKSHVGPMMEMNLGVEMLHPLWAVHGIVQDVKGMIVGLTTPQLTVQVRLVVAERIVFGSRINLL